MEAMEARTGEIELQYFTVSAVKDDYGGFLHPIGNFTF